MTEGGRHILLGTPTAGNVVRTSYVSTVVAFTKIAQERGWTYDVVTMNSADVVLARNFLANQALRAGAATDLLFIDSDMEIAPNAIVSILDSGHGFVGAACPLRRIDMEVYAAARARGHGQDGARALAMTYNLKLKPGDLRVLGSFAQVDAVGFGLAAIKTDVLRQMADAGTAPTVGSGHLKGHGVGVEIHDFFSPLPKDDGSYFSEDFSFCQRLHRTLGGEVWAYLGPGIGHDGTMVFEASFLSRMAADQIDRQGP